MEKSTRILLIEDNKHDQYFFTQAILDIESAALYHIANNGQEALAKLKSSEALPDLIFTDIHMPVMDGIECLSEIIKIPIIQDIPVVVLSSDTTKIDILTQMGVKAFIEKPVDCKILQKLVEHVLCMDFVLGKNMLGHEFQAILSYPN